MLASIPRPADYDVSPHNGFLPSEVPLDFLDDPYYRPWETTVQNLQALISTKRLRGVVERLPLLSTDFLRTEPEWRRAYSILAFMVHSYIWGGETPLDVIPPTLSIPFLATCRHLELPPVATYAGLVLWNWRCLDPASPPDSLENIFTLHTCTGSLDESWFYLVSVAIEARGAPIIPMMLDAIQAARYGDNNTVTECLRGFAERLDELATLLQRMYENCDPHVFYHRIRPFLAGSKNMADAGLPNGVIFDDGSANPEYVQFSGGSNAQSSIIQFFDLVLGVEHRPTGEKAPGTPPLARQTFKDALQEGTPPPPPSHNFIKDMRTYMPGGHRRFLEAIASVSNIRDFVATRRSDRALCTAFDACLAMLRTFRDKHIQMVSRYIIVQSRESRTSNRSISPSSAPSQRRNIASALKHLTPEERKKKDLRGTGGTALIPFLKQARDETGEPAIDAWAARLLNNGPGAAEAYERRKVGGGGARLTKVGEQASGQMEVVGLAGVWSVDDSEGGICHW
ncbi:Indoleamine 2,3-dioxygenase [Saccharata proteae CBS 121410]|uniref:Indoleamine 2,3-dioxygenase n=1 Tax=Saccharata proteae CBS 121410 TaxID=1314787 RepID=A0A9P4HVP4_9PEZI|nr:Indoleamine 2,3-dioxygenase [Saccharata proteae CBS 121410]